MEDKSENEVRLLLNIANQIFKTQKMKSMVLKKLIKNPVKRKASLSMKGPFT